MGAVSACADPVGDAIAVGHLANDRRERVGDHAEAVASGDLAAVGRADAGPERRVRLLERLELHRHVGIAVELAGKAQRPAGQRLAQDR
jgi:hypothetical protein